MVKRKSFKNRAARSSPSATHQLDVLSLMIAAVALTACVLFFFPWLELEGEPPLSGLDIASRNLQLTENFPSGVVFILPLVAGSLLFQFYRRVRDAVRPRRRAVTALMLIVGLVATGLWIRVYTINATDYLNQFAATTARFDELPIGSAPASTPVESPKIYTTGDILRDHFTFELWLHLALSASLLFLPFLDTRSPAHPPGI